YILGRVYSDHRVVDHAWNEFRGIQFDLTREIFALETLDTYQWQEFSRIGSNQLKMLLNQEHWAPSLYDLMASKDVNIEI
ncbi:MAG: hypothetical protein NT027_01475, partial [Proteobacteria bacterium]|nr:hypothetical protein [Pseudomonadota bacterium]